MRLLNHNCGAYREDPEEGHASLGGAEEWLINVLDDAMTDSDSLPCPMFRDHDTGHWYVAELSARLVRMDAQDEAEEEADYQAALTEGRRTHERRGATDAG